MNNMRYWMVGAFAFVAAVTLLLGACSACTQSNEFGFPVSLIKLNAAEENFPEQVLDLHVQQQTVNPASA